VENTDNIKEELRALGIELPAAHLGPNAVPENYFEQFPVKMAEIIEAEEVLAGVSKEMPHYVPNQYFELFPELLTQKVLERESKPALKVHKTRRWYQMAVAASIALLLTAGMFFFQTETVDQGFANQIAELSTEEVDSYLDQTPYDKLFGKTQDLIESTTVDVESLEEDILSELHISDK